MNCTLAACLEVWWLLPGHHQGCTVTGTRALLVCPSSVPWCCSVVSPRYCALDHKADEMEVLGRWLQMKSAWGQTTGPGKNQETRHSYFTSPPCPWETESRPQSWEEQKGGEALWIPRALQWLWRKQKICGDNISVQLKQLLLLTYCSEVQHQNINEIF